MIDASPAQLVRSLAVSIPCVQVGYRFEQLSGPPLAELAEHFLGSSERASPR